MCFQTPHSPAIKHRTHNVNLPVSSKTVLAIPAQQHSPTGVIVTAPIPSTQVVADYGFFGSESSFSVFGPQSSAIRKIPVWDMSDLNIQQGVNGPLSPGWQQAHSFVNYSNFGFGPDQNLQARNLEHSSPLRRPISQAQEYLSGGSSEPQLRRPPASTVHHEFEVSPCIQSAKIQTLTLLPSVQRMNSPQILSRHR